MRNVIIFLNRTTNEKIVLTNRKIAWLLYAKINLDAQKKYVKYARFAGLILKGPLLFLDYEVTLTPLYAEKDISLDELYKAIVSEPAPVVPDKKPAADVGKVIPVDSTPTTHHPESDTGQNVPTQ